MYHVANMLPYDPQDEQQIARKKHIGNDVVVFIFMMGAGPFDPSSFVSGKEREEEMLSQR